METVNYYGQELKIDNEVNALKIKQAISYVEEAYEYVSKYLPVNEGSLNSGEPYILSSSWRLHTKT